MKLLPFVLLSTSFWVATACNDSEPAATGYKKQLAGASSADQVPAPPAPPTTTTTPPAKAPTAPAGDSTAGQTFFTSNSCAGCHGANGKGTTPLGPGPYTSEGLNDAKPLSPAHATIFPTVAADVNNLIAFLNTFK